MSYTYTIHSTNGPHPIDCAMEYRNDTTLKINGTDQSGTVVESCLRLDNKEFFLSECFLDSTVSDYTPHKNVTIDNIIDKLK